LKSLYMSLLLADSSPSNRYNSRLVYSCLLDNTGPSPQTVGYRCCRPEAAKMVRMVKKTTESQAANLDEGSHSLSNPLLKITSISSIALQPDRFSSRVTFSPTSGTPAIPGPGPGSASSMSSSNLSSPVQFPSPEFLAMVTFPPTDRTFSRASRLVKFWN